MIITMMSFMSKWNELLIFCCCFNEQKYSFSLFTQLKRKNVMIGCYVIIKSLLFWIIMNNKNQIDKRRLLEMEFISFLIDLLITIDKRSHARVPFFLFYYYPLDDDY